STVLQAKQAIALARFAGADRDAADELKQAEDLYSNADEAWRAGRREADVDVTARQAIGAAVKAESLSYTRRQAREARNEQSRTDAEMRSAENRLQDALNEIEQLKRELAGETRNRELSERDVANYTQQIRDLRAENTRLSEELGRERVEMRNIKSRLADFESRDQQAARAQRIAQLDAGEPELMRALRKFGAVAKNERGVVLTLPETFWANPREARFSPNSDPTLNELSTILANNPDYHITIESHTDDSGEPDVLNMLTRQRSTIIAERLSSFGIENGRIEAKGLGAAIPVAPNTTNANRARNRRVQLIIVPNI
ncbi:MAG: OmpA family protein, partial [Blastocatellia bacterium]|nr:OmpA family protein [Blastocatellia bacterium]